jgi:ribose 5-phosphate isomerase B
LNIAIGADHRGYEIGRRLSERLRALGHQANLVEGVTSEPCDYPIPASRVAHAVAQRSVERGILICGTGIGVSIAANKVAGVRAALVADELSAQLSRTHNDANVLCLSGDLLSEQLIDRIVEVFLNTTFEGGRHERRRRQIDAIEAGQDPSGIN